MLRYRQQSWLQKKSRFLIGAIAIVGLILTLYLTISKMAGGSVACDASGGASGGCNSVLDSPYAYPLDPVGKTGPPLSLFGALAYFSMATFALSPLFVNPEKDKQLRQKLEDITWWFMLVGAFVMASISSYLMYVLAFKLHTVCYYCIGSALFSFTLLLLTLLGHDWEDIGQVVFTGVIVILLSLVTTLGVYARVDVTQTPGGVETEMAQGGRIRIPRATTQPVPPIGWAITTKSGAAEIALAEHLAKSGAVMYSAYWCPHCYEQKQLFGKEAFAKLKTVECDPAGLKAQPQKCREAQIRAFPTWIINGKVYEGVLTLDNLADLTGYKGNRNFRYSL